MAELNVFGLPNPPLDEGLKLVIEGTPVGKQRPRYDRRHSRMYTPNKTHNYEQAIALTFKSKYPHHKPYTGPVLLTVIAYMPIPKSYPKYKRVEMAKERVLHTKTPDWDNIAKVVCDALNGLAWVDDRQVMGQVFKLYSDRPRLEVYIREVKKNAKTR